MSDDAADRNIDAANCKDRLDSSGARVIELCVRKRRKEQSPMEIRVYYHDTDAGGVVYYGNYLKFLEEARTEFLEQRGLSVVDFHRQGLFYAVRRCSVTYRSPARYGDALICTAELQKITAAQIFFRQKIVLKSDTRLIVEADVVLVCLDRDFKPVIIPEPLRKLLMPSSRP